MDRLISAAASYNIVLVVLIAAGLALVPRVAAAAAPTFGIDPSLGQIALALVLASIVVPAHPTRIDAAVSSTPTSSHPSARCRH